MMGSFRDIAIRISWNALMIAAIYLPVFVLLSPFEIIVRQGQGVPEIDWLRIVGDAAFLYVFMMIPLIVGSLIFSGASLLVPQRWSAKQRRYSALLLSLLVPATVILLDLPWALILRVHFVTIVASVAYGMFAKV